MQDAIILLMKEDAVAREYRWEEWDSDVDLRLPRASITMTAEGELSYGDVFMVTPTITLEGRPRKAKLSTAMFRIHRICTAANLHELLEARAGGTVRFYQRAERFNLRQSITGSIRQRQISFSIAAAPLEP